MDQLALTLVFHPVRARSDGRHGQSSAFADAARQVLGCAPGSDVCLVSPYLSTVVVKRLVDGRRFRLITDLRACPSLKIRPER